MIVGDLFSNLGNQLFIYAATKSISMDLGYDYRYRVIRPSFARSDDCIDDHGNEYCNNFEKAFNVDVSERVLDIPQVIKNRWEWNRQQTTNFNEDVYNISDNTQLCGYFLSPRYFEHRRQEVLKWFHFQDELLERCYAKLQQIVKSTRGATHIVSIHMRYGKDVRFWRLTINPSYYQLAIKKIRHEFYGERLSFILFSDVPDEAMRMLKNEGEDIILHHGTMFEDLCLMSLCDSHIIANSTFSWWGAWLSESTKGIVVRPSVWPTNATSNGLVPEDICPSDWLAIKSRREKLTVRIFVNRLYDEYPRTIFAVIKNAFWRGVNRVLPTVLIDVLKSVRNKCRVLINNFY